MPTIHISWNSIMIWPLLQMKREITKSCQQEGRCKPHVTKLNYYPKFQKSQWQFGFFPSWVFTKIWQREDLTEATKKKKENRTLLYLQSSSNNLKRKQNPSAWAAKLPAKRWHAHIQCTTNRIMLKRNAYLKWVCHENGCKFRGCS